jgi:ParB/RepB/Spo0J family partition protein
MPELRMVPLELLVEPPFPMREQFGDMPFDELVESIRANGIKQPLLVRPVNGHYEVMAGHRRMKAAGVCALVEVPCLVEECDDLRAVETMVAENSGREDVTATEEGRFYLSLVERFKLSEEDLYRMVKKSPSYVDERLALVRCDNDIAEAVLQKAITFSAAKEILRVNPYTAALVLRCSADMIAEERVQKIEQHRKFLLDLCVRCGATQRVARSYVEQWKRSLIPENPYPAQADPVTQQSQTLVRLTRCLACGRDADPQNMLELKIHYYEKDKIFQVLRDAGLTLYE